MPHTNNRILATASPVDLLDLRPRLRIVELQQGQVVAEIRQQVSKVYFPHSGILSCVVELRDGGAIETGMIGNDGEFGAAQALNNKVSLQRSRCRCRARRASSTQTTSKLLRSPRLSSSPC